MVVPCGCSHRRKRENIVPRIFLVELTELPQEIPHALILRLRHHYLHLDNLVAALPRMTRRRGALFAQPQPLAAIGARRDAHLGPSIDCGHVDFRSEGCLAHGDGHDRIEVVTAALEKRMRLYVGDDVEVARRRTACSSITVSGYAHARTGLCARRDTHI